MILSQSNYCVKKINSSLTSNFFFILTVFLLSLQPFTQPHTIFSLLPADFKSLEGSPLSGIPHFDTNKATKVVSESAQVLILNKACKCFFFPSILGWLVPSLAPFVVQNNSQYRILVLGLLSATALQMLLFFSTQCSKIIGNITPLFCLGNASFFSFQPSEVCLLTRSCFLSSCNSRVKIKTTPPPPRKQQQHYNEEHPTVHFRGYSELRPNLLRSSDEVRMKILSSSAKCQAKTRNTGNLTNSFCCRRSKYAIQNAK